MGAVLCLEKDQIIDVNQFVSQSEKEEYVNNILEKLPLLMAYSTKLDEFFNEEFNRITNSVDVTISSVLWNVLSYRKPIGSEILYDLMAETLPNEMFCLYNEDYDVKYGANFNDVLNEDETDLVTLLRESQEGIYKVGRFLLIKSPQHINVLMRVLPDSFMKNNSLNVNDENSASSFKSNFSLLEVIFMNAVIKVMLDPLISYEIINQYFPESDVGFTPIQLSKKVFDSVAMEILTDMSASSYQEVENYIISNFGTDINENSAYALMVISFFSILSAGNSNNLAGSGDVSNALDDMFRLFELDEEISQHVKLLFALLIIGSVMVVVSGKFKKENIEDNDSENEESDP